MPALPKKAFDERTMRLVDAFGQWFDDYTEADIIDLEDFKTWFFSFRMKHENRDTQRYYNKIIDRCEQDPSPKEAEGISTKLIELGLATKVANLCQQYQDGYEINIIQELGAAHEQASSKLIVESQDFHITDSIEDLLEEDKNEQGLRLGLSCLRNNIRPIRRSDLIIVAGRPDTGKTSFIASQLPALLAGREDRSRPFVWFNNEGIGSRIVKRLYQSVLCASTEDLLHKQREGSLNNEYRATLGGDDPFRVIDAHNWDTTMVEKAIKHYNPSLCIFDMLDNVTWHGTAGMRTDQILENLYQWARELGVRYDFPVIATSQISAEVEQQAHTQCWPPLSALKDSKTGKQGAADTIIMIGRSPDPDMDGLRYISAPKNKLSSNGNRIKHDVQFDGQRSQYTD